MDEVKGGGSQESRKNKSQANDFGHREKLGRQRNCQGFGRKEAKRVCKVVESMKKVMIVRGEKKRRKGRDTLTIQKPFPRGCR